MSTTSLPSNSRRPKTPTLRDTDWEPLKPHILRRLDSKPLHEVASYIESEYGFKASLRQYKSILKKWNVGKNIKRSEMKAIVRKQVQRKLKESEKHDLKFSVRNQLVPQEKIDRFMRSEQIPRDVPYSPASGAPTPLSDVFECWTPRDESVMKNMPSPSPPDAEELNQILASPTTAEEIVPIPNPQVTATIEMWDPGTSKCVRQLRGACGLLLTLSKAIPVYDSLPVIPRDSR